MNKYCYSADGVNFDDPQYLPKRGFTLDGTGQHTNLPLLTDDILRIFYGWYITNEIPISYDSSTETRIIDSKILNGTIVDCTYTLTDILATWSEIKTRRDEVETSDIDVTIVSGTGSINRFHADIDSYRKLRAAHSDFSLLELNPDGNTITWKTKSIEELGEYVYRDVTQFDLRLVLTALVRRTQKVFAKGEEFRAQIGTVTRKTIQADWSI